MFIIIYTIVYSTSDVLGTVLEFKPEKDKTRAKNDERWGNAVIWKSP